MISFWIRLCLEFGDSSRLAVSGTSPAIPVDSSVADILDLFGLFFSGTFSESVESDLAPEFSLRFLFLLVRTFLFLLVPEVLGPSGSGISGSSLSWGGRTVVTRALRGFGFVLMGAVLLAEAWIAAKCCWTSSSLSCLF